MKKTLLRALLPLVAASAATAAEPAAEEIGFDEFFTNGFEQTAPLREMLFDLSDVDGNKKLSTREFRQSIQGATQQTDTFSPAEQQQLLDEMMKKFAAADSDNDGFLNREQGDALFADYLKQNARRQFDNMDSNKNGFLSFEEQIDFSRRRMEAFSSENLAQKLEELNLQLDKMAENPAAAANRFLQNTVREQAAEEFFIMDTDRNNLLTKQEYIDYTLREQPELFTGSVDDKDLAGALFDEMDQNHRGYLNEKEYVDASVRSVIEPISDELIDTEN